MPTVIFLAPLAVHTYARPNYAYTDADDRTPAPALLVNMPAKRQPPEALADWASTLSLR